MFDSAAARVTMIPVAVEMRRAGISDTRPSPTVSRVNVCSAVAELHALLEHADRETAQDVDDDDDDLRDGVTADKLAGAVHGSVEVSLALNVDGGAYAR